MSETLQFPWGKETLSLHLPDTWRLLGIMRPSAPPAVADAGAETARSLQQPCDSPRLSELAKPGMRVALVVDDDSRPTPVARLLPPVLDELQRGGVKLGDITVVPALGLHRPMTFEELDRRLGGGFLAQMQWRNPQCDNPEELQRMGVTRFGTPVEFDRVVCQADLVVSIGCIEPHVIASFGGGYKNLLPGVAGRATIAHNHSLNCQPATFNNTGAPIEANPMRLDLEEAGAMLKAPVFIINAVLDSALQVVRVVSGHPVAAQRAGAAESARIYGVPVPEAANVVITNSYPMESDLRQGVKALANTIRALKPGGVMITLVRAEEGVGVFGLANRKLPLGKSALRLLAPILLPQVPRLKLKGMGEEDRFFLYFALQAMRRGDLLLYAPTIPQKVRDNLVFVDFVESPQAALQHAVRRFPQSASVLVFPSGGSTYPILPA